MYSSKRWRTRDCLIRLHNPGPVAGDKPGYYRLPYWPPLAYLEAVGKRAGECANAALADKVMRVIRSVSQWRDEQQTSRQPEHLVRIR